MDITKFDALSEQIINKLEEDAEYLSEESDPMGGDPLDITLEMAEQKRKQAVNDGKKSFHEKNHAPKGAKIPAKENYYFKKVKEAEANETVARLKLAQLAKKKLLRDDWYYAGIADELEEDLTLYKDRTEDKFNKKIDSAKQEVEEEKENIKNQQQEAKEQEAQQKAAETEQKLKDQQDQQQDVIDAENKVKEIEEQKEKKMNEISNIEKVQSMNNSTNTNNTANTMTEGVGDALARGFNTPRAYVNAKKLSHAYDSKSKITRTLLELDKKIKDATDKGKIQKAEQMQDKVEKLKVELEKVNSVIETRTNKMFKLQNSLSKKANDMLGADNKQLAEEYLNSEEIAVIDHAMGLCESIEADPLFNEPKDELYESLSFILNEECTGIQQRIKTEILHELALGENRDEAKIKSLKIKFNQYKK